MQGVHDIALLVLPAVLSQDASATPRQIARRAYEIAEAMRTEAIRQHRPRAKDTKVVALVLKKG